MENKIEILKQMGFDISPIIDSFKNPLAIERLTSAKYKNDIVIEEWTEDEIILFSNKVYDIIKKYYKE